MHNHQSHLAFVGLLKSQSQYVRNSILYSRKANFANEGAKFVMICRKCPQSVALFQFREAEFKL